MSFETVLDAAAANARLLAIEEAKVIRMISDAAAKKEHLGDNYWHKLHFLRANQRLYDLLVEAVDETGREP